MQSVDTDFTCLGALASVNAQGGLILFRGSSEKYLLLNLKDMMIMIRCRKRALYLGLGWEAPLLRTRTHV